MAEKAGKIISRSLILETKCGHCNLVCSVAPVSEKGGLFYCGRCYPSSTPSAAFQTVAKEVMFPCVFRCGDLLPWDEVKHHETLCKNRNVVCPFMDCTNTSSLECLCEHINKTHGSFDLTTPFVRWVQRGSLNLAMNLHCIKVDNFVLLFFVKLERKDDICYFNYDVCLLWPQDCYKKLNDLKLKLEIENPSTDVTITKIIYCKDINMYNDRSHCLNCLYSNCEKKYHENKFTWMMNNIPLNMKCNLLKGISYTINMARSIFEEDNWRYR